MALKRRFVNLDWVIKQILRKRMDFEILEGFLSELLEEDIHVTGLLESESNKSTATDKFNRVDLLVENSKGEYIIIEVQHDAEVDFLHRVLYGVSKLLIETIKSGGAYGKIKKIISVSIVFYDLGTGEDYLYKGCTAFTGVNKRDVLKLNSLQQEVYKTEKISDIYPEYYIIKVNKFDDITRNRIDEWIFFLKNEEMKDSFQAKGLKKAKEELDILKLSPEERIEYENDQENNRYHASMVFSNYITGQIEGKREGEKNKAMEMAKRMKEKGSDIPFIAEISGLTPDEIEKL